MERGVQTVHGSRPCEIAARLGSDVPCPAGGCALLVALGYDDAHPAGEPCPISAIAERGESEAIVFRTLDELRLELDRAGLALSATHGTRSRARRHDEALRRWPVHR